MNVAKSTAIASAAAKSELDLAPAGRRFHSHGRLITSAVLVGGLVVAGGTTALMQGGHHSHEAPAPYVGRPATTIKAQRLDQRADALADSAAPEGLMSQIHAVTGASSEATRARTRLYQELRTAR